MTGPKSWEGADPPDGVDGGGGGTEGEDRAEVRRALAELLRSRPGVVDDPDRLEGYLRDLCPSRPAEVAVVLVAARAGVADELSRASQGHAVEALSARLVSRLQTESGIDGALARWAVDAWAAALGMADRRPPAPQPTLPPPLPASPVTLPPPPPAAVAPPPPPDEGLRALVAGAPPEPPTPVVVKPVSEVVRAAPPDEPVAASPAPAARVPAGRTVHRPPAAPAPSPPPASEPRRSRRTLLVLAGALVASLVLGAGVFGMSRRRGGTSPPGAVATSTPASTVAVSTSRPSATTAAPKPLPAPPAALAAGAYAAPTLRPAATLAFPAGWRIAAQSQDDLEFSPTDNDSEFLSILRPVRPLRRDRTFPAKKDVTGAGATEATPPDFVAWLASDSKLSVSPATPVTKAGVRGVQVDVTVKSPYDSELCPVPCDALFQLDGDIVFTLYRGNVNRFYVLTVGDSQVLVVIEAPADQFQAFVARADRIVDTVAFTR